MNSEQKWDLAQYRISNATKTLVEVDVLIQNRLWNTAVNRIYYACFYAVSALLVNNGINTKTHSGAIQMFGLHFVSKGLIKEDTGNFYTKLYSMRHKGDYEDYFDYDENDVLKLVKPAGEMVNEIRTLLFKQ
jgi:uncharacterized protein (UPF0332 family)